MVVSEISGRAKVDPTVRRSLTVLLAAVGFLLLITCLNLSNLLLSRSIARQSEVSIRLAIGAGRWTLIRQFMTESLVLAALGGAAAVLVASAMLALLPMLEPGGLLTGGSSAFIRGLNFEAVDLTRPFILGFNLLLTLVAGVLFGALPAVRASRVGPNADGVIPRHRRITVRRILVVAQVSLAVVLLVGAGIMLRSFNNLLRIDVGINPDRLVALRVELPGNHYSEEAAGRFFQDLAGNTTSLPGVESVAFANTLPLRGQNEVTQGTVDGKEAGQVALHIVSLDYFRTLGIPLLKGRLFTDADRSNTTHVAIISESAARRFFGDRDPIGHLVTRTSSPGEEAQIIGIVGDSKYRLIEMEPDADVYVSHLQADPWLGNYIVVKTAIAPESLIPHVRAAVQSLDPQVPIYGVTTMNQVVANATARTRFSSVLLGIFAGLALIVASVGVYGMLTYAVAQRTREIGIRIALGAERSRIGRMVAGDGLILCIIGLVLGLIGAYGATRLLRGLLYQITPTDPATFAAVALLLVTAAPLACWLPARRATRVDPIVALRYE